MAELYKRQSALEAILRSKRALVDTAKQALNIETAADGHGEEKLQSLIEKWRGAAQKAADVLFGITSQRVANSGPGGWKEMIRKRGWDEEDKPAPPANLEDEDDEVNPLVTPLTLAGWIYRLTGYRSSLWGSC